MTNGNYVRVDPIQVGPVVLKPSSSVTCLGVIWSNSLSPKESIAYNISKARRSFFASGISKRKLNPLCSKEVFEVCSLPICLYGCENWLLTDQLLKPLEDFQAEVGKKILNLPKHHANVSVLVALGWPTMRLRILNRKLSSLWKLMNPQYRSISSDIFNLLKDQDPGPLIVQQSRLLEQIYGTNVTSLLLNGSPVCLKSVKKTLFEADQDYIWSEVESNTSLALLPRSVSWCKLWDKARDHGFQGTRSLQVILRTLTIPTHIDQPCPLCDFVSPKGTPAANHIFSPISCSLEHLLEILRDDDKDSDIFSVGKELKRLHHVYNL